MKTLKTIILFFGILSFITGSYNIVYVGLANQWFCFIAGAFLVWLFFNIHRFINEDSKIK